jgi:hypothetical protein
MYDVIGDIHGHADALRRLLAKLGYEQRDGCFWHPARKAVFVGDFIDRGPAIRGVLEIARAMVERGTALAVMGNHEFNAVAFHMQRPDDRGAFLRERTYKNIRQYRETVAQLSDQELADYMSWFQTLPMWLDLGGLRVVHACWDPAAMQVVGQHRQMFGGFDNRFFHLASEPGEALFSAVEVLLKGRETRLPDGVTFMDKDGNPRKNVRTKWYLDPSVSGATYRDYTFSFRDEELAGMPAEPLSPATVEDACPYGVDEPPVLFGHYWMPSDREPAPLAPNVACLDYSVAKEGRLCAYRWSGESTLRPEGFVSVACIAG